MGRISAGIGFGSGVGAGVGPGRGGGVGGGVFAKNASPTPIVSPQPQVSQDIRDRSKTEPGVKPTGERAVLESKLHPEILKAFDCWKKSGEQCEGVREGKVQIQIFLSGSSSDVIAQLKALGFESTSKTLSAKILVGSLPVEKLPAVIKVAAVQFVSPIKP
jgi:hypothetical protein